MIRKKKRLMGGNLAHDQTGRKWGKNSFGNFMLNFQFVFQC